MTKGIVHSIQTMGTVDGPGIRFVVFVQGCNLRCKCCHNPDTWDMAGGREYAPEALLRQVLRYREYFVGGGGITVSGGEPLLQATFVCELFALCKESGIHTCLDTAGSFLTEEVKALLSKTDRVLLDIKYTKDALYRAHVGCSLEAPMAFLSYLDAMHLPTTLRQVIIPGINDTALQVQELREIARTHACVDKIELLPFRKICQVKYDDMQIEFPFGHIPEPNRETMETLTALVSDYV